MGEESWNSDGGRIGRGSGSELMLCLRVLFLVCESSLAVWGDRSTFFWLRGKLVGLGLL